MARAGMAAFGAAILITLWPNTPAPGAAAEPSTPATTATSAPPVSTFPSDEHGYLNSAARCDDGQTLMVFGRTARSLVAVCVGPDGQLQYRGVRIGDGAELIMGASRAADGAIIASNDDVTYSISPDFFLVSAGDNVLYRDKWDEFHQPRVPTSTPSSTTTASSTPSPATTSPTVSTTTVTPAPQRSG